MATNGVDVPVMANNLATRLTCWYYYVLQRLDGRVEFTDRQAFAHGGFADIYPGVISDVNIVVGTVRIHVILL